MPTGSSCPSQSSFHSEWKRSPLYFSVRFFFRHLLFGTLLFQVPDYRLDSEPVMSTSHGTHGRLCYINKAKMASVYWPYVDYFFIADWGPLAPKPTGTKLRFFRLGHLETVCFAYPAKLHSTPASHLYDKPQSIKDLRLLLSFRVSDPETLHCAAEQNHLHWHNSTS